MRNHTRSDQRALDAIPGALRRLVDERAAAWPPPGGFGSSAIVPNLLRSKEARVCAPNQKPTFPNWS